MKKYLLYVLIVFGTSVRVMGQVSYHDIVPDTTISNWMYFNISPYDTNTSNGASNCFHIWWHPVPEVVVNCWNDCEIGFDAGGNYPAKLNAGDNISAAGNWQQASYAPLFSGTKGNWISNSNDKYLPFRVKNNNVWNYGWLKMSVGANASSFTLKEWAINSLGSSINTGQTTGTGDVRSVKSLDIVVADKRVRLRGLSANVAYKVGIYNTSGIRVLSTILKGDDYIDVSGLADAMYVLQMERNGIVSGCKIVIQ